LGYPESLKAQTHIHNSKTSARESKLLNTKLQIWLK